MYVCLCIAVTESTVNCLLQQGKSIKDIVATTGAGSSCGSCVAHIRQLAQQLSPTP